MQPAPLYFFHLLPFTSLPPSFSLSSPHAHLEYVRAPLDVRSVYLDLTVEAPGPRQGGVQDVYPEGGGRKGARRGGGREGEGVLRHHLPHTSPSPLFVTSHAQTSSSVRSLPCFPLLPSLPTSFPLFPPHLFVPARTTTPVEGEKPSISTRSWFSVFSLSSLPPENPVAVQEEASRA